MDAKLKLFSKITNYDNINPLFSKVLIRIAYTGLNRNNSFISKATFEAALPTIFNVPIIGEFSESIEDFKGHGGKIEITEDSIKWINTTAAYGVIDANSEVTWEEITENDGTVHEYLCATGYLWTGRYPELESVIENSKNQSMEIEIVSGKFSEINGSKCYEVTEFIFSGFCILGDSVEPCFESSEVMAYSLNNFKQQFNQMLKELKFYMSQNMQLVDSDVADELRTEGGKDVPEQVLEMLQKYNLTLDNLQEKEIDYNQFSLEELENKVKEVFVEETEIVTEEFSLSSEQLEDELERVIGDIETLVDVYWEEYTYPRYELVDFKYDISLAIAYDRQEGYLVSFNYTVTGDKVEVDAGSLARVKVEYLPMDLSSGIEEQNFKLVHTSEIDKAVKVQEHSFNKKLEDEKSKAISEQGAKFDQLQTEYTDLVTKYATLEATTNDYAIKLNVIAKEEREFAESALFESFAKSLTLEDMAEIKAKKDELSLDDMKKELALVYAMKTLKFNLAPEVVKPLRMEIPVEVKSESDKPYAGLIEQRSKK